MRHAPHNHGFVERAYQAALFSDNQKNFCFWKKLLQAIGILFCIKPAAVVIADQGFCAANRDELRVVRGVAQRFFNESLADGLVKCKRAGVNYADGGSQRVKNVNKALFGLK